MVEKPLHRYSSLDSGQLCKLFRSEDVYIPSANDDTKPDQIMRFIDIALASEQIYTLGHDPRYEAFIFAPNHNEYVFQAHFAVRKDKRDGSVVKNVADAGKWIFENTTCRAIMGFIREENARARTVMGQLGMKRVGKIPESIQFDNEMQNEIIYYGTAKDFNALWGKELGEVTWLS